MRSLTLAVILTTGAPALLHAQEAPDVGEDENIAEDYVEQGTVEIGGALGASVTEDTSTFTASPSVGYFVADRVEVSGIFTFAYTRVEDEDTGISDSDKTGSLIIEPSYHHPVSDDLLVAAGLGVGAGYDGDNFDFEIVPSVGLDILTSRSNAITPTVRMPIVIGESNGRNGDIGTDIGLAVDVGITTKW